MSKYLIVLGHGYDRNGRFDPGAHGNGTNEGEFLNEVLYPQLKKYATSEIDFYKENMFANRDAQNVSGYDEVIELHLDAAAASVKGGHVIIHTNKQADALDRRLGAVIENHFGLRGGRMFDKRNNLLNLNVFQSRGISFRMLELGFITNRENMDYFRANVEQVAKDLIAAILNKEPAKQVSKPSSGSTAKPQPSTSGGFASLSQREKNQEMRVAVEEQGISFAQAQRLLIAVGEQLPRFGADGHPGSETGAAFEAFQIRAGISNGSGRNFGRPGPQTIRSLRERVQYRGVLRPQRSGFTVSEYVRQVQRVAGVTADGKYGPQTAAAVRKLQSDLGVGVDGIFGPVTFRACFY